MCNKIKKNLNKCCRTNKEGAICSLFGLLLMLTSTITQAILGVVFQEPLLYATTILSGSSMCIFYKWYLFYSIQPPLEDRLPLPCFLY